MSVKVCYHQLLPEALPAWRLMYETGDFAAAAHKIDRKRRRERRWVRAEVSR